MQLALSDVDLVLNAAGPFLHTASPLAQACLSAGVHYLDISNELQVFRALYDLDEAGPASWRHHHPRGRIRRRRHQLPGAPRERGGRRCRTPRGGLPGRVSAAGPRRSGNHAGEPPLRRLDPRKTDIWSPRSSSPESRPSASPTGPAKRCPSRPAISKRPSTPQDLPTSLPTPSALPSRRIRRCSNGFDAPDSSVVRVGPGNRPRRLLGRGVVGDRRLLRLHSGGEHPSRRGDPRGIPSRSTQPCRRFRRRLRLHDPRHQPDRASRARPGRRIR